MSKRPAVSICIPTFNGAEYLRQAMESALSQSFGDFELLVSDDASTDDTMSIAGEYARQDGRVVLHQSPRRLGLGGNWNRCLELAKGEWVKFLFQDDYLSPNCVARMYERGAACGATLVACDRNFVFEASVSSSFRDFFLRYVSENNLAARFPGKRGMINNTDFASLVAEHPTENCIGEPTSVMFRRSARGRYGHFNVALGQLIDWEYWERIAVNEGLCFVDEPLATFRLHGRATTMSNQPGAKYGAGALDALIIRHELVYHPLYEPVREAARRNSPRIDLKQKHLAQYYSTRALARDLAREQDPAERAAVDRWQRIVEDYRPKESYPRALLLSSGYYAKRILKKLVSLTRPRGATA
ncbi:MAG TPA: glycosyltransferase family A protein [Pyrinomonadaceae bacterium]|jgi:glycosyltransferase involved in cell wall biosynthesis